MRIVIDLQGAQTESRFRGIGRYALSLTKAIVRNRGDHEIIIALSGLFPETIEAIRSEFNDLLPQENIRVWYAPGSVRESEQGNKWRREAAELIWEAFLASLQPDIIHITSLFEGFVDEAVTSVGQFPKKMPVSVSLYDLIPLLNPEHYFKLNPAYKEFYLRKVSYLRKSSLLLAISAYTQQEGIECLGGNTTSIVNVSTAVDAAFHPLKITRSQRQALGDKFGFNRPFLLYTGGADERKNLPRLIRAYASLSIELREACQLVFAGKMPEGNIEFLQQEGKAAGLRKDELIFTGHVSDDELIALYNLCKLYVFPSWHEGFGLPALEAMSCGAAVIGAYTSSLPEVIGNAEALFDPFSEADIASKIASVLSNENFRKKLKEYGHNQAKKFSWDKSAKAAITAFENTIEVRNNINVSNRVLATHVLTNQIAKVVPREIPEQGLILLAETIGRNHPLAGLRQFFVDISELCRQDSATGVQRVTRSILIELLNSPPAGYRVEPVYASTHREGYYYARKFTSKLLGQSDTEVFDEPLLPMQGDIFLGLDLQHHVVISQENYFSELKDKGVLLYFVVYDLLPIVLPGCFAAGHSEMHAQWLEVISRFDGLACISQAVAVETREWICKHFAQRNARLAITNFHLGADIENSLPSKGFPKNYQHTLSNIEKSCSFLMVGTLEPRKGQKLVLSAFEELWSKEKDVNLVLVGKQGWMVEDLIKSIQNHPQLGKRLFWLNGISDEYLEEVYKSSTCLIAASEGEGFGLPLIEAAQRHLPMIVRDIPVFREVVGSYAYYFKGNSASELVKAIEKWTVLFKKRKHPVPDGMPWITWKQSTDHLLEVLVDDQSRKPVKQLFLDISELVLQDAGTGIQRVVRSLLKELLTHSNKMLRVEPVYATTNEGYRYARNFIANFSGLTSVSNEDDFIEYNAGDIFLCLDYQPQVQIAQQDFYQQLRRHGVVVQFVVYDLLCILMPQYFVEGADTVHSQWLDVVTENDGALCISMSVSNELEAWMKEHTLKRLRPFQFSWFHLGADIKNSIPSFGVPDDAGKVLALIQERPSFLMVGTIEPRKGHEQTLAAFEQLWADGANINLVIVGKQGWMVEGLIEKLQRHNELGKRLFWLEGASDEYLEKIYAASDCLIAASEAEGFGLPLIEAAQHKLPIVARDIPVFREVVSDHAFYFSGMEAGVLVYAIKSWLNLFAESQHPKASKISWLTWKQSAAEICKILNLLDSKTKKL